MSTVFFPFCNLLASFSVSTEMDEASSERLEEDWKISICPFLSFVGARAGLGFLSKGASIERINPNVNN